jgi:hypothetical protein
MQNRLDFSKFKINLTMKVILLKTIKLESFSTINLE